MRILHITNIPGNKANGIASVLSCLTIEQDNLGNQVVWVSILETSNTLYKNNRIIFCKNSKAFYSLVHEFHPNICIFHSIYLFKYLIFFKYLIQRQIPYAIQLHGSLSKQNYKRNQLMKI